MSSYGSKKHWLVEDAHMDQLARETFNLQRYQGKYPTWEQIAEAIRKSGCKSMATFQRTYNFGTKNLLRQVKHGGRGLPVKFWHFIYEVDNLEQYYQDLFQAGTNRQAPAPAPPPPPPPPPPPAKQIVKISEHNKTQLDELRKRLRQQSV